MLLEISVHKSGLKDYCSNFFESSKRRVNNSNDHSVGIFFLAKDCRTSYFPYL